MSQINKASDNCKRIRANLSEKFSNKKVIKTKKGNRFKDQNKE